jgi:hypothetical protein
MTERLDHPGKPLERRAYSTMCPPSTSITAPVE